MRAVMCVATVTMVTMFTMFITGPAFAQMQTDRVYITGVGGFTTTPDTTSRDVMGEVGVRVARNLFVFGDLGQFHNLQPSVVQPMVDAATAILAAGQGLNVVGTARVPAWYSVGGLRYEVPIHSQLLSPYVLGGLGFARLNPTAQFTFAGGPMPDGSTQSVGADVTTQIVAAGDFTAPPATNALMFTLGGGVQIPVARHWAIDAGYRFSRVAADTPFNAHGAAFGFGYRF
jgi:opacity protein-like surface antigen